MEVQETEDDACAGRAVVLLLLMARIPPIAKRLARQRRF
jgi:hypothetical protein